MPEDEPRKGCVKIILLLCIIVLLAGGAVVWWMTRQPERMASAPIVLPDGTRVSVVGTSYGTNHVLGNGFARLASRAPDEVQDMLRKLFGPRAVAQSAFTTPTPTLVVWLDYGKSTTAAMPGPGSSYQVYLGTKDGSASGPDQFFFSGAGTFSQLQFSAFSRRERVLSLNIYSRDSQGKLKLRGSTQMLNPLARTNYPQWQPEPLPVTRRTGDVEATLVGFAIGRGSFTQYGGPPRAYAIGLDTNESYNLGGAICRILFQSLSDTNETWRVDHFELSDATGNVAPSSSMNWGAFEAGVYGFSPVLWTNEAAWKLRCEIKRTAGFASNEVFTFKNAPLGEMNQTNILAWSTNVNGITLTLDHIIRRPPITNGNWGSGQATEAAFRIQGMSNDFHLDLLRTQADDGTNLNPSSWSTSGDSQSYDFPDVTAETKTLDFTFAVQQGRWVEFLVKPDTKPARFEIPAKPKEKKSE